MVPQKWLWNGGEATEKVIPEDAAKFENAAKEMMSDLKTYFEAWDNTLGYCEQDIELASAIITVEKGWDITTLTEIAECTAECIESGVAPDLTQFTINDASK